MVMIMMKMMTGNLKCVHHRLQNTSFYSRCPPPDYKCHQVSTVFTQIDQIHQIYFLVRFMLKAWLIKVVGGGSRTEDFPYSAGWVICIIFIINCHHFYDNHGKKKKMTYMIYHYNAFHCNQKWYKMKTMITIIKIIMMSIVIAIMIIV